MSDGFSPCFPVVDMRVTLAHYEQLGFAVMPYAEGAEWAWVRFGTAELHLYLKHVDPDNNLIRFGSPLKKN